MTEQREKAAAEPPLDCRVGRCVTTTANKPSGQVWVWTGRGFRVMTEKDAAIDEIRAQPFFAPNA